MQIEKLRDIIEYSQKSKFDIESWIRKFYAYAGIKNDSDMLNVMQIVKDALRNKGYFVLEFPLEDKEIGALCYEGDALGYIVLNTSVPKVNNNFAICHELYHAFCQKNGFRTKIEFTEDYYQDNEEEMAANMFAGMLLMPESSFRTMYNKFAGDLNGDILKTLASLMNYYQVPYMAALVRCFELELLEDGSNAKELLEVSTEDMRRELFKLWLDDSILDATGKDDYRNVNCLVKILGREYVDGEYLSQNKLNNVLKNMDKLYSEIRGGMKHEYRVQSRSR